MKKASLLSLAMILLLASCSVKKRVYMAGYHVEWLKSKNAVAKETQTKSDKAAVMVTQTPKTTAQIQIAETPFENAFVTSVEKEQLASSKTKAIFSNPESSNYGAAFSKASTSVLSTKKIAKAGVKAVLKQKLISTSSKSDDIDLTLLYILCIFIPFVAVGLVTDWDITKVLINLLLSILCWIPGIIHAFITVKNNR